MQVTVLEDLGECGQVWRRVVPPESLFDLWEVRACFQMHYGYRPRFLVAEQEGRPRGLLALSAVADHGYWGCFPGETFNGKTWLEQNRITADSAEVYDSLLRACPDNTYLRYLVHSPVAGTDAEIYEIGYLFHPGQYDYCFENYLGTFSGKSRKRLGRELAELQALFPQYYYNNLSDIERLFDLNRRNFAGQSYFDDDRFRRAFRDLFQWLHECGWLRITTVILAGQVAAVDAGAVYRGTYTLLAGGTDARFLGVAKLINMHHIQWACQQRLEAVDFLCGDFGWKERFHLSPRPLYQVRLPGMASVCPQAKSELLSHVG